MFLSSFSMMVIFLFFREALQKNKKQKKRHKSQDFLFSSSWLQNTGKMMQTWCNTSDQKTKPSLVTNAAFPRLLVMETGKKQKTVNTTNLRQPRRLLVLDLLETRPSSSPTDPHFHDSVLFYFISLFLLR